MGEVKKLADLRLSLSIKAGTKEENFLTAQYYDLEMFFDEVLKATLIKATCKKTGLFATTSIHNMIQCHFLSEVPQKPIKKTVKNVSK